MTTVRDDTDPIELLHQARCGGCSEPIMGERVNIVALDRLATWEHPTSGNVLTGEKGRAVAVVCDTCIERRVDPTEAIEFADWTVRYHEIASLEVLANDGRAPGEAR